MFISSPSSQIASPRTSTLKMSSPFRTPMTSPHKIYRKSLGEHTNDMKESRKKKKLIFADADAGYALFCFESPINCSCEYVTESNESVTERNEYVTESKESVTESKESVADSKESAAKEDDVIFELMCCSPVLHKANSWMVIRDECDSFY